MITITTEWLPGVRRRRQTMPRLLPLTPRRCSVQRCILPLCRIDMIVAPPELQDARVIAGASYDDMRLLRPPRVPREMRSPPLQNRDVPVLRRGRCDRLTVNAGAVEVRDPAQHRNVALLGGTSRRVHHKIALRRSSASSCSSSVERREMISSVRLSSSAALSSHSSASACFTVGVNRRRQTAMSCGFRPRESLHHERAPTAPPISAAAAISRRMTLVRLRTGCAVRVNHQSSTATWLFAAAARSAASMTRE
ncbi:hypothetical protein DFJ73DRAFT_833297 [Zopfochytrium polystomum]|nr:hypothetical protein DFJ73DRAFT_833297 [Zopfochytrium polystomum]